MHLQNRFPTADIRQIDHHLAVETAGTQQRAIQDVRSVCCGDDDHALIDLKPVHLHQERIQGLFPLVMPTADPTETTASDGVDLVNEDETWGVFLGLLEHVADT